MNINEVINSANNVADENEIADVAVDFVNDAIAKINAKCGSVFPFFRVEDIDVEIPIPETWVRTLIVPFVAGRIKTKDSSQFEYTDLYNEFMVGIEDFMARYKIPEAFIDRSGMTLDPITGQWVSPTSDVYTNNPFGTYW